MMARRFGRRRSKSVGGGAGSDKESSLDSTNAVGAAAAVAAATNRPGYTGNSNAGAMIPDSVSAGSTGHHHHQMGNGGGSALPPMLLVGSPVAAAEPTLAGAAIAADGDAHLLLHSVGSFPPGDYVTQPPRPAKGLTGKISTLFRREDNASPVPNTNSNAAAAATMAVVTSTSSGSVRGNSRRANAQAKALAAANLSNSNKNSSISSRRSRRRATSETQDISDSTAVAASIFSSLDRLSTQTETLPVPQKPRRTISRVAAATALGTASTKRIFYSSHQDDDSDDSYESRVSRSSRASRSSSRAARGNRSVDDGTLTMSHSASNSNASRGLASESDAYYDDDDDDDDDDITVRTEGETKTILRYRGFSTSIKSLFLDEPLVCASMGCFGLILSNRTEYLLALRNERRGTAMMVVGSPQRGGANLPCSDRKRLPSKIISQGLLLTLLLMFATFVIWGFGTGNGLANEHLSSGSYHSNNNNGSNKDGGSAVDDQYQWWDDYLKKDDYYYNNRKKNRKYYQDDNDNQKDDDDYFKYNDDGGGGGDDKYKNKNGNDDGANGDDGQAGDDRNNGAGGDDDQYQSNDDGRRLEFHHRDNNTNAIVIVSSSEQQQIGISKTIHHPFVGICKLRDYHEHVWIPTLNLLRDEWQREAVAAAAAVQQQQRAMPQQRSRGRLLVDPAPTQHRRRRNEQAQGDDDASGTTNDGSNGNDDASNQGDDGFLAYEIHERDLGSNIRIALVAAFLVFLGIWGRRRRMRTRYHLVRARAQEDHLYYASSDQAAARRVGFESSREDQYEGACSHTLCGCYPVDDVPSHYIDDQAVLVTDHGIFRRKKQPYHEDVVARAFNCLLAACCGVICKCWFQCLSVCALAQEGREVRLLLPPRYQRIDYITHQPFHEYQKEVNDLRRGWMGKTRKKVGMMPHYHALSRLSRYILIFFTFTIISITATLIFNPLAAFSWQDAVVLAATFVQSFLVLFVVHWIFHKSDLSLDAVIKFFAAGFLIAVPTAFFFEGLLVNLVVFVSLIFYELVYFIVGEGFSTFVFDHWRFIWILGELFNAYVVAAVTEELCKYYTFRAMEHPDLVFLTGLQRTEQDETAFDGGLVAYPFASHQVEEFIRDDASVRSSRSQRSNYSSRRKSRRGHGRRDEHLIQRTGTTEFEFEEDENDVRTYRQKAMAITTGMISVAVGLACAENCLYVFVLGGALGSTAGDDDPHKGDVIEAWIVLFFRSIFPVHALAAAMQSINMIRKFVESTDHNGHRIGVGRIILPAVIIHGSFDAVLMGINVYMETAWDKYMHEHDGYVDENSEPYNALIVNLIAWVSISLILVCGIVWYYLENRSQRLRLKILEDQERSEKAGEATSWSPGGGTTTTSSPSSHRQQHQQSSSASTRSSRRTPDSSNDIELV